MHQMEDDVTGFIQNTDNSSRDQEPIKSAIVNGAVWLLNNFTPIGIIDNAGQTIASPEASVLDKAQAAVSIILAGTSGKTKTKIKAPNTEVISSTSGARIDPKTGQKLGGSGKPRSHTVAKVGVKATTQAARDKGKGKAVYHNKDEKGGKHYHSSSGQTGKGKTTKKYGKNTGKVSDNVHYTNKKKKS